MSVLGTTKYSLCNCIDTWQTRCIVLLVKKTKTKNNKKGLLGFAGQSRNYFMQDILYQDNAVLFKVYC